MKTSRIAMNGATRTIGSESQRRAEKDPIEVRHPLCNPAQPGTREEVILVPEAPVTDDRRRGELADFLRTRRAALQPEDVGLPRGRRRRTPGLRREEVAQIAGVGATWYTWLEQGRSVRASRSVLEALAGALRLTPVEREHLLVLGRGDGAPPLAPAEAVSPAVRRLVEHLDSPALLLGRRWDMLAWNEANAAVFGDPADLPPEQRNVLWAHFTDPARRELIGDWEGGARRLAAEFRAACARHAGDPAFTQLQEALREASPEFHDLWRRHEVARPGDGRKVLNHPGVGRLCFEHAMFRHAEHTEQRLVLYSPLPDGTAEKLAALVAARRRAG
jgi:transcriptional regulator with XRE-family HTH domain